MAATQVSAVSLKDALWTTLEAVRTGKMTPQQADAVAVQAREILRTVKIQLQIAGQSKRAVPLDVLGFATDK